MIAGFLGSQKFVRWISYSLEELHCIYRRELPALCRRVVGSFELLSGDWSLMTLEDQEIFEVGSDFQSSVIAVDPQWRRNISSLVNAPGVLFLAYFLARRNLPCSLFYFSISFPEFLYSLHERKWLHMYKYVVTKLLWPLTNGIRKPMRADSEQSHYC